MLAGPVAGDPVDGGGVGRVECRVINDQNAVPAIHLGLRFVPECGVVGLRRRRRRVNASCAGGSAGSGRAAAAWRAGTTFGEAVTNWVASSGSTLGAFMPEL